MTEIEAELTAPPLPPALAYLWQDFLRMHRRRRYGPAGPLPVGWDEIMYFQQLTGRRFAPWEIDLIERLDAVALDDRTKDSQNA